MKVHFFLFPAFGELQREQYDAIQPVVIFSKHNKRNFDNKITYLRLIQSKHILVQYSDGKVTAFLYDEAGNMTFAANQNIAYTMTYDSRNRITQITDSNNRIIKYQYDGNNNRTQMITPENKAINYLYDDNNLLSQIITDSGTFASSYDAANRRITRSLPNGTTSTYSYDERSLLTGILTKRNNTVIDSISYTLDNVGNRISKTQQGINYNYTYDALYRLVGVDTPAEAYTYDKVGNRLTAVNEQPPAINETTNYIYDEENRLTGIQIIRDNKSREITFAYDPFGRRIAKTLSKDEIGAECTDNICPRTTNYVYDNQNIILEYNTSGDIQARYLHGINIDEPLAAEINNSGTTYYYHQDGLGSITALSNATGNIVQTYSYDSFGNTTINGTIKQPYGFTAREYDTETNLYFYRARYYDPRAGRFISKDPIGFRGGINQYAYVSNNPINLTDPKGLSPCSYICHTEATAACIPACHWMWVAEPAGPALVLICHVICHEIMYDRCMATCEKPKEPCKK